MSDNNIDWEAIDSFVADADKDDRYGDHDAMVLEVKEDAWPSGETFYAVEVALKTTRNNASLDIRLPKPMSKDELKAAVGTDKYRGIALGQKLVSELHRFYGVNGPGQLKAGDMLRVKIGPQKSKKTGGNFPRVIAFKPKDEIGKSAPAADDAPPF